MSDLAKTSPRAARIWIRLTSWYGTRLTELYGAVIPPDWAAVVDSSDNDTITRVLATIREKHTTYPPTFPEFDQLFTKAAQPSPMDAGPGVIQRLVDFCLNHKPLTPNQLRMPWKFLGSFFDAPSLDGKMRFQHGCNVTGVEIPADGEHPGYRVMLIDVEAA